MKVILQPCGNPDARQHYVDTIANLVALEAHMDLLRPIAPELHKLYPEGKAAIWGVTPGKNGQNAKKFLKATVGDVVLFARDGRIISTATLALKHNSAELARRLWSEDANGQTWEFIYFLDEVKLTNIPYPEFNAVVGYKPNFIIQGFSVLDDGKSIRVLEHFGFLSGTYSPPTTKSDFQNAILSLANMEETERKVQSFARKEQDFLRQVLFNSTTHKCAICGREYPIELLVAAHIKRRAACSKAEKLDAENIVMPACKFGCDEVYERGYIAVNEQGEIVCSKVKTTQAAANYLESIAGRTCSVFKESNAHYFKWHRRVVFRDRLK